MIANESASVICLSCHLEFLQGCIHPLDEGTVLETEAFADPSLQVFQLPLLLMVEDVI